MLSWYIQRNKLRSKIAISSHSLRGLIVPEFLLLLTFWEIVIIIFIFWCGQSVFHLTSCSLTEINAFWPIVIFDKVSGCWFLPIVKPRFSNGFFFSIRLWKSLRIWIVILDRGFYLWLRIMFLKECQCSLLSVGIKFVLWY